VTLRRLAVVIAAMLTMGAAANDPRERLPDPAQEARARELFEQIRCMVCQNESIDDSEAPLAADLRRIVRAQVREGRSDGQIRFFLQARYGEFVLMRPTMSAANVALWTAPFAVVLIGGVLLVLRRRAKDEPPLSAEEQAQLAALESAPDA
jgi:cytochrome c-type biogenesis protein CcmH